MDEKQYMAEAIALSEQNVISGRGGPFGAVIVKDGKIIATGVNRVTIDNDPTAHGEIVAIRAACKALNSFILGGCEIYSSCEPCPMCMAAIYWARAEKVYYAATREDAARAGFDDWIIYNELNLPIEERAIATANIMRDEAQGAFGAWAKSPNKVNY